MPTKTMSISLPATLKDYIRKRVAEGDFSNASDYIRHLLREERKVRAEKRLEVLLLEGLDSGPPVAVGENDYDDLMREVNAIIGQAKRRRG